VELLRLLVVRYTFALLLVSLATSETLILQWALLVNGHPGLGALGLAGATLGLVVANVAIMTGLRALRRIGPLGALSRHGGRAFTTASLGALFCGPPLAVAFVTSFVAPAELTLLGSPLLSGGGMALALGFGSLLWGRFVGARRLVVEEVDLPVRGLPDALAGLRIAHLSDIHIGNQLPAARLRQYVERVNELEADLIVITGDIFDFDPAYIEQGCGELAKLSAPLGVFAIIGNHDVYTGVDAVDAGIRQLTPIRLLRNEVQALEHGGARFHLAGIDDPAQGWTERDARHPEIARIGGNLPTDGPTLLLAHRPSYFRQAAELGFPVVLSGHTHGGQISLPAPAHHANISRLIAHWTRGRFEIGDSVLYVSRGLGVAGPAVRLNCPREIGLLSLIPRT
jgi:predicted MPP superfamily phosphohydrolase